MEQKIEVKKKLKIISHGDEKMNKKENNWNEEDSTYF